MENDRIDKYILIKRLAVGGMGEIFLAEKKDPAGLSKKVVIKRLLPDLARDEQFIDGFEDEARIAMQLNHSNIVQVFDFGWDNDRLYLVSEYVEGMDLGQVLTALKNQGKTLPINLALGILIRVAGALFYAHTKTDKHGRPLNIVHRDINPTNVLISFNGDVKITDFGIAKFEARKSRTLPNQIKGKVMYLAPEMIAAKPVDHRADIFSFGSMAYEILAMEHPFSGTNEGQIIDRIRHAKHLPLHEKRKDLPGALVNIVEKCLKKDPNERYQDMDAVQQDLTNYLFASHTVLTDSDIGRFLKELAGKPVDNTGKATGSHPRTITISHSKKGFNRVWVVAILTIVVAGFLAIMALVPSHRPPKTAVARVQRIRSEVSKTWVTGRRVDLQVPVLADKKPKNAIISKPLRPVQKKAGKNKKKEVIKGSVVFRFFPARAVVKIDGKQVTKDTENGIVRVELVTGNHILWIQDPVTKRIKTSKFTIQAQRQLNLGTIMLGTDR